MSDFWMRIALAIPLTGTWMAFIIVSDPLSDIVDWWKDRH